MRLPIRPDHPIRTHFCGLVENAFFTELGLCEPKLTAYLADLLVDFMHVDRLSLLRRALGRDFAQMAALLSVLEPQDARKSVEERDRDVYRHIGDLTLFWTGVFPEYLRSRRGGDLLNAYVEQGKRSYAASARLAHPDDRPPADLLLSLSEEFETCVHGLGLVRRNWNDVRPDDADGPRDLVY
ncbi:MAG: hypothetical protein KJ057_05535 [Phycisphaerae bacterium]|nr:MAG: hypothetical protein EDS66_02295 [Planctomycetota bacterium]KAB2947018.1 MAG: hypothetical protein F9K17_07865 [Phycisphaerae bacterium]MBE7456881.1 hypothetical protein [Planctomycetia bacterium]MCK6464328.1 hypothetical protein [Phycisphaerae bacterium]MCL4717921.1 hypothetical protein [Phycisphaerae bacterium]